MDISTIRWRGVEHLLCGVLWGIFAVTSAVAQPEAPYRPVRFERAAMERHLPQSSAYAIVEDQRGFLWFGTREGLGRWDGYEMRTWKIEPFNPNSLPGNVIHGLVEDRAGHLWVWTVSDHFQHSGIARVVGPAHETVRRYGFRDAIAFLGSERNAWLATPDSLYRFVGEADRFQPVLARASPGLVPTAALTDQAGILWVGTADGTLERCDPADPPCEPVASPGGWPHGREIPLLFEDEDGTLWVGSVGEGLGRLDRPRRRLERFRAAPDRLEEESIQDIEQDADGWLWMVTSDGVYRFDPAATHFERYPLDLPGVSQNTAGMALHIDRSGTIWVGTVWGLYKHEPHRKPFAHLQHDPDDPHSLSSGLVMALHEDTRGDLWVGTFNGGLNRIHHASGRVTRYRHRSGDPTSLSNDVVWGIAEDPHGPLWIGTDGGLNRLDPISGRFSGYALDAEGVDDRAPPRSDPNTIHSVAVDEAGRPWVGSNDGLYRFDPVQETFSASVLPDSHVVSHLRFESDGGLWIGTTSNGVLRLDRDTGSLTRFAHRPGDSTSLSYDAVLFTHRDRQGTLWVGTNGGGLNRLDEATGRFTHFTDADGLPSNSIFGMLEDDQGRFWLSTNRGLVRFDPRLRSSRRFRVYDGTNGVQNVEFNRRAFAKTRNGTMYFGGDKGVTFFDPDAIHDNPYRPPVVITALRRSTQQGTTTTRYISDDPVRIAPSDYTFAFEVAALNFTNPHRNQYAVQLDGFDAQWVTLGTRRVASYTNVPPGEYLFRVKASNDDGLWNEEGLAVPVIVEPWFWQTWWFRGALGGAFVGLIALITWYVSHVRYRRQLQAMAYRQALEQERSRISRDMHDEVGASLTEIAILSELAQRSNGDSPSQRTQLQKIAGTSRAMLDAIGEIIWAVNPRNDRLDHLAAYLREYAAEYLAGIEIERQFDFSEVPSRPVTAEFRRNVFLVLKEALANVSKHAEARRVTVTLSVEEAELALSIEDDGQGMDVDAEGSDGNGLHNMRHRAEAIGGTLTLTSALDQGTRVRLRAPLPRHASRITFHAP